MAAWDNNASERRKKKQNTKTVRQTSNETCTMFHFSLLVVKYFVELSNLSV